MSYGDIIKRIEDATGPDRGIDRDIAEHIAGIQFRLTKRGREWLEDSHGGVETWSRHPIPYTASIDEAIALLKRKLPRAELEMSNLDEVARVTLHDEHDSFHGIDRGNRLAIALLIALFRALEAKEAAA